MNLFFIFTLVTGICYCQIQSNFINWGEDYELDYDDDYEDNYDEDYEDYNEYAISSDLEDDLPGKYLATIVVKR